MKYDARILAKLALIFFGLLFLICIWLGRKERRHESLEGEKITVEDVVILMQALEVPSDDYLFLNAEYETERAQSNGDKILPGDMEVTDNVPENRESDESTAYLTYEQYIQIREKVNSEEMNLPDYAERYEKDHALLKEDWYAAYRLMLAYLDPESSIWETTVFLLQIDPDTKSAYTESGGLDSPYQYQSGAFEQNLLRSLKVYVKGSELLTVEEVMPEEYELKNVWVMEQGDGKVECFYHQIVFRIRTDQPVTRECVADLTFREGELTDIVEKQEKVHGKLLRLSEKELEIEGYGVYQVAGDLEVYKLYGILETKSATDLRIGYADTDFVVYKGQVCAALICEEETADKIRVLLKNPVTDSNYYDSLELAVDGETIQVQEKDLEVGERRVYQCAALTDKIEVRVEGSTRENNSYRGTIECYRTAAGMVVVNELPLEEYLYAVVPSEMPSSYPLEAMKAQAVCARTYAYRHILHAGLPEVGAHLDDTTSYQVYHNISEAAASTTAVKETSGILLTYQGEPAENYYYSTSCGVGTDAAIWQSDSAQDLSYLQALRLNWDEYHKAEERLQNGEDPETVEKTEMEEDDFYHFITSAGENDLEREEPWYRWTYSVDQLEEEVMEARIQKRYAVSPASVLTKTEGEYYVSQPIGKLGRIRNLSVARRGAGGVVQELVIEAETGTYKILSEYNIRYILCDGAGEVVRQDGNVVVPGTLLPSGFFVLETGKEGGNVIGYTLIGGGYGHGVGLSQNGAKALGKEGASCRMILEYFFPGCELENLKR